MIVSKIFKMNFFEYFDKNHLSFVEPFSDHWETQGSHGTQFKKHCYRVYDSAVTTLNSVDNSFSTTSHGYASASNDIHT